MDRLVPGPRLPLPARDRVLLHLSEFGRPVEGGYPPGISQCGIAERTDLGRAQVAMALKSLREEGLVEELKGRVAGEARRRKLYALTEAGRAHCRALLSTVMDSEVVLRREGEAPRRVKLSESSFLLPNKLSLVELALSIGEGGALSVGPNGALTRPLRRDEGEGVFRADAGERAESGGAPGGAGYEGTKPPTHPRPSAEPLLGEIPTATEAPLAREGAPAPSPPPPPESPSAVWRRLGAVVAGALALMAVLITLGLRLGMPLPPDFLLTYFVTLVMAELVMVGAYEIPASARAELGIFIGAFLALYGGVLFIAPPIQSLLWLAQGALLLSSGLLISPLTTARRFQTACASAGAFMVFVGSWGLLRLDGPLLRLFSGLWIPAGVLFITPRFIPARAPLSARLRAAAAMAAGSFLLALGLFLLTRGLYAEGFVELVVGGVAVFYAAPRGKGDWDAALAITSTMLSLMVVLTTITALFYFTGQ